MTVHQLRIFLTVARHRSYSRAAEDLYLSQPAVSIQIRELEQAIGAPLFERAGRNILLTEAGEALLPYAQRVHQVLDDARMVMEELQGLKRGRITLAAVSTAGAYVLPPILGLFREAHPGIVITLEVTNRSTLRHRLLQNEVDLVLMGRPPDGIPHVAEPFLPEELVVIAAPSHPLTRGRRIPVARLAREVFIQREVGSGTRLAVEEFFRQRNADIQSSFELGDNSAVKEGVAAGLGVAVLHRRAVQLDVTLKRLVILDVQGFPLKRQWHVVHRKEKQLSQATLAFKVFLLTSAEAVLAPAKHLRRDTRK
ncbi:MAG: LysR family transcriptional regulator [Candidatus Methylomirabilales bacterium]